MIKGAPKQVLLIAPDLLGESLSLQLNLEESDIEIVLNKDQLIKPPSLVIWSMESIEKKEIFLIELNRLKARWEPSPILLLLPSRIGIEPNEILEFECEGILQSPDIEILRSSIEMVSNGGRIIRLNENANKLNQTPRSIFGIKDFLLTQGLKTINGELNKLNLILTQSNKNILLIIITKGRKRELKSARTLLTWLFSPSNSNLIIKSEYNRTIKREYSTSITITGKDPQAIWNEIYNNTKELINEGSINSTNNIFAIQGLKAGKQNILFTSLLSHFNKVIDRLREQDDDDDAQLLENWTSLEKEIRENSVREVSGNYCRLMLNGESISISDYLLKTISLTETDEEIPSPSLILNSLISNKPIMVEGNLLSPDDPRAILRLQMIVMNWIIRTGEIISSELVSASSEWPELREYLLHKNLISTRELERLRNQLNSQRRWQALILRPIQLYESKREFLQFKNGYIESIIINESRDKELRALGWWQQQVTLVVEARDALAPQLQSLLKHLGNLMVVILTNVLGRAIGLVGRGIAQGMGRSISR